MEDKKDPYDKIRESLPEEAKKLFSEKLHFDRKGNPIDFLEWGKLFSDRDYQVIKQDNVNGIKISTVWLGNNHNWGEGPPIIFESMLFDERDVRDEFSQLDQEMVRYSTEEEALEGHTALLARVKHYFRMSPKLEHKEE